MANTTTDRLWKLDTVGIVSNKPVHISKIVLYPSAASDAAQINSYGSLVDSRDGRTATISGANTFTAAVATDTPTTVKDGDVFEIVATTGDAANKAKFLVTTAGNPSTGVIVVSGGLANESSKMYSWRTYDYAEEIYLKAPGTTGAVEPVTQDFDPPRRLPNLILESLSSSATVHVYIA